MKNLKIILGVIVLSAVLGFFMVSCTLEEDEYTWKFINNSSYTVSITETNFNPSEFDLAAGESRSFTNTKTAINFQYSPAPLVALNTTSTSSGGTSTFTNK